MNAEARTQIDDLLATLKSELATPGTSPLPLLAVMSRFLGASVDTTREPRC
jgi:hypothetical protein